MVRFTCGTKDEISMLVRATSLPISSGMGTIFIDEKTTATLSFTKIRLPTISTILPSERGIAEILGIGVTSVPNEASFCPNDAPFSAIVPISTPPIRVHMYRDIWENKTKMRRELEYEQH